MAEVLNNLRTAYHILKRDVILTLRTQLGADTQLTHEVTKVLRFLQAAEQVSYICCFFHCVRLTHCLQHQAIFPPEEYAILQRSLATMVEQLDEARHLSSDPSPGPNLVVATRVPGRGRPRLEIDRAFLVQALALRGPTHLAAVFNCNPRTVRRAALRMGLVQPGNPVYTDARLHDGTVVRTYSSSAPAMTAITNEQLDTLLTSILQVFPDFGRRMLVGRLKAAGYRVPRDRLRASYLRVHGSPSAFGIRFIHRRPYTVAGANSLWHHDGQHGVFAATFFYGPSSFLYLQA